MNDKQEYRHKKRVKGLYLKTSPLLNIPRTDDARILPIILENPDKISDEVSLWPERDYDDRQEHRRRIKKGLDMLNERQKQILFLLAKNNQTFVGKALNISQPAIAKALATIRKKFLGGYILP